MAKARPTVRWNEDKQRWMAWVRFPDGSRKKVERADRGNADQDLDELSSDRASFRVITGAHRRRRRQEHRCQASSSATH